MGEVFKLNHCYNMDCLPAMELFPDNYFDLAVVDAEVGKLVRCWLKNVWPLPQLRSLQSRLSHLR